ncbi:hypothetical protein Daus18300_003282 [Diaporthe australafricana]|uniref:Protein kinase domain-containing protein n=1 Tax=Diaporthe australafricana TaxID=127596 RepID=A0ABR3XGY0_9PEZI
MDPVSAAGLALSVAGLGLQIYTGCIAGIQLLITAANFPEDCRYLNLRLRMEQQRLFAWSETSGLTDLGDAGATDGEARVLASNTFLLHRQTVLDLLVQVQCLFDEFRRHAERNHQLRTFPLEQQQHGDGRAGEAEVDPERDAAAANFPLPPRRRDFIRKAMRALREKSSGATLRLRWVSFDKVGFETLLARFAALNDGMTGILDVGLQREIHHSVQDTNRGVLQLHRRVSDLGRLVRALNVRLEMAGAVAGGGGDGRNRSDLEHLSQLAKFKAFNESMEAGDAVPWDAAEAKCLELVKPNEQTNLQIDRSLVILDPSAENSDAPRCEALLKQPDGTTRRCWVEWKEYENQMPGVPSPPKEIIIERARKLAALLNHSPKPKEFRTPRCLGFFDMESPPEDILNCRLGLIFERPQGPDIHPTAAPASLHDLLTSSSTSSRRPSVTQRVRLAHALAHCLLYLHAVSWLHKGLRSTNILFFRTASGAIDHGAPLLSGFDFSRPARADEMTEDPPARARDDLYRHPSAQSSVAALGSWTAADGDHGDGEGPSSAARPRSRRSFDIYSLGVLLVEVAHWRTVDRVLGIDVAGGGDAKRRISPRTALGVRARLLGGEVLAEVGACMGEVFEGAARRCVAGGEELGLEEGDDEASDAVAARLLMRFWADVVKVLGDVRV